EILAVPREAVDLAVGPVGHVDPPRSRRDRDAMSRVELARSGPSAAKGEVEPRRFQRTVARHARGEDSVEARIPGGDVEEAVEELDVGGHERPASREVVAHRGQAELVA